MKMVNVKLPKRDETNKVAEAPSIERDQWPYGLRLTFEAEQIDKLPHLEKMKVGQKVMVEGMGEVTSVRMNENKGGKKKYTVEVQLHECGCEAKGKMTESMGSMMKTVEESKRT